MAAVHCHDVAGDDARCVPGEGVWMRVGDCLRGEVMVDNESKGARVRAIDQSGCEGEWW